MTVSAHVVHPGRSASATPMVLHLTSAISKTPRHPGQKPAAAGFAWGISATWTKTAGCSSTTAMVAVSARTVISSTRRPSKKSSQNNPGYRMYLYTASRLYREPPEKRILSPPSRSEEHTSELQSRPHLVCRLLLEKKKKPNTNHPETTI